MTHPSDPIAAAREALHAAVPVLQAVISLLDTAGVPSQPVAKDTAPRYLTRKAWTKLGGERRVFDRAIASREVRAFRPGRELMVLAAELFAWVEKHVEAPAQVSEVDGGEVVAYERFAAGVRARRAR